MVTTVKIVTLNLFRKESILFCWDNELQNELQQFSLKYLQLHD